MAEFIQVGFTAARDPATGDFLPAVPLYIEKTADAAQSEAALIQDLGKLFASRMRLYYRGRRACWECRGTTERAGGIQMNDIGAITSAEILKAELPRYDEWLAARGIVQKQTMNVVSYGGGTNSTAMLIGMQRLGFRVDLILFADTGAERPETYKGL